MKLSPFEFGKTVSDTAFTNREKEIERLKNNLISGINSMIISPRRWGKSSLVNKVSNQIRNENDNIRVVNIDLFSYNSTNEFLESYVKEIIKSSSSHIEDWVRAGKDFFKNVIPRLSFAVDPMSDFSVSLDFSNSKTDIDEILNLPEQIAKSKKIKFVINIDEFQNIIHFKDYTNLENKLRSVWQNQKLTTYCLYGSKRHLMEDIFTNSSKPFYKFGDIIFLQKISREKWVSYITQQFRITNKCISEELAGDIADLMNNHPWYVQQLSHFCWVRTNKEVSNEIFNDSLEELINSNIPLFQREVESLSRTQLNLLKAIANNEQMLTSVDTIRNYKLGTPSNVLKSKSVLLKNDLILENGSNPEITDPVFLFWFKREFLKNKSKFTI